MEVLTGILVCLIEKEKKIKLGHVRFYAESLSAFVLKEDNAKEQRCVLLLFKGYSRHIRRKLEQYKSKH